MGCPQFRYPYRIADVLAPVRAAARAGDLRHFDMAADAAEALLEDRDVQLEDFVSALPCTQGAGGRRYATKVVAASDSLDHSAGVADLVCTGTADDAQIRALISSIPDPPGGKVLFMEGHYDITDDVFFTDVDGEGMGVGTVFNLTTRATVQVDHATLSDLKINGTGTGTGVTEFQNARCERVLFTGTYGANVILLFNGQAWVERCILDITSGGTSADIEIGGGDCDVSKNLWVQTAAPLGIHASSFSFVIEGNRMDEANFGTAAIDLGGHPGSCYGNQTSGPSIINGGAAQVGLNT